MWCEAHFSNSSAFLNSNRSQCWWNVITYRMIFEPTTLQKKISSLKFFQGGDRLVSKPTTSSMLHQSICAAFSFKLETNPSSSNPKSKSRWMENITEPSLHNWLYFIILCKDYTFRQTMYMQRFLLVATKKKADENNGYIFLSFQISVISRGFWTLILWE